MAQNWWDAAPVVDAQGAGPKARPDWGPGALGMPDGSVVRYGPKGGVTILKKASEASATGAPVVEMTEGQARDGFNAKRMTRAGQRTTELEAGGFDPGLARIAKIPNPIPFTKGDGFSLPIKDKRSYESAEMEWADAMLRLTTGAAATKEEVAANVKTYFPQFGDSADVRKEKAAKRAAVEKDALFRGGPGSTPSANALGAVVDLSKGQSRNALARGALYRDPYGNIRRNENGDRGNPKIDPITGRNIVDASPGPARPKPASGGYKIISVE